jgi:hypothetical protein
MPGPTPTSPVPPAVAPVPAAALAPDFSREFIALAAGHGSVARAGATGIATSARRKAPLAPPAAAARAGPVPRRPPTCTAPR